MKYIVTDNTAGVNVYVGENEQIANALFKAHKLMNHSVEFISIFQAKEEEEYANSIINENID